MALKPPTAGGHALMITDPAGAQPQLVHRRKQTDQVIL